MSQNPASPNWASLTLEQQKAVKEWIRTLMQAKAASEALSNLLQGFTINAEPIVATTNTLGGNLENIDNSLSFDEISQEVTTESLERIAKKIFTNTTEQANELICLPLKLACTIDNTLTPSNRNCEQEYQNCLKNT